ncbi:MAG: hypothetical protein ACJA0M_002329 [Chitinophagales bacterium]|mgnify:CR=1 FL=1|jgi:hypothetical protein|tara:strand:+ start:46827 stop:47000 length:174 start_codon:yes stop_codon:yes gene_type:complete
MTNENKASPTIIQIDEVEAALEERGAGSDRRVFVVDLPSELERRSGADRREKIEQGE